jgi:general secretion pathway protein I
MRFSQTWNGVGPAQEDEAGFTLLEVLVALGVLSLSLTVLWAVFSQGLDRTREDQTRMAARSLAQSLLADAETMPPSLLKTETGETNGFTWRIALSPYGSSDERQAWTLSPTNIAIEVSWADHGRDRMITLTTLRLLPKGAS